MPFQKRQLPEEEEKAVVGEKALEEEEDPRKFKCRRQISLGLRAGEVEGGNGGEGGG
jgi:hypothetical protein